MINSIKSLLNKLKYSPLHPQWLIFRNENNNLQMIAENSKHSIVDIGCGNTRIKEFLPEDKHYIGLDYFFTSSQWYLNKPDLYGDARKIPIKNECYDTVLLLDVLEHINEPNKVIQEIFRILKPTGNLIIQTPFMYPLHDAPFDFHRWTSHGLSYLLEKNQFKIKLIKPLGGTIESALLLFNIGLSKILLNAFSFSKLSILFIPLVGTIILINNLIAFILSLFLKDEIFLNYGYSIIAIKDRENDQQ